MQQIKSYSFSFIFHLVSCFLSLALSVNRSHSPFTRMLWIECPPWLKLVGNSFVPVVFYVSQVFFEAGVRGASRFADVEFGAFGAMINVHDVVRLAVGLFGDVHLDR